MSTNPIKVGGLDIGFSETKPTSAVGILDGTNIRTLERRYGGEDACKPLLQASPLDVIAIDGPITPNSSPAAIQRNVERVFSLGEFQKRCKPGMSHVSGTGFMLRTQANQSADRLVEAAPLRADLPDFPKVREAAIVEAFPNVFLGVCLDDATFKTIPVLKRGKKFDWLYDQWVAQDIVKKLDGLTADETDLFSTLFRETQDHELRAGIICTLTALFVARGQFTAVGDDAGGWFFLPPWSNWANWSKQALVANTNKMRSAAGMTVKIIRQ